MMYNPVKNSLVMMLMFGLEYNEVPTEYAYAFRAASAFYERGEYDGG